MINIINIEFNAGIFYKSKSYFNTNLPIRNYRVNIKKSTVLHGSVPRQEVQRSGSDGRYAALFFWGVRHTAVERNFARHLCAMSREGRMY